MTPSEQSAAITKLAGAIQDMAIDLKAINKVVSALGTSVAVVTNDMAHLERQRERRFKILLAVLSPVAVTLIVGVAGVAMQSYAAAHQQTAEAAAK